VLKFEILLALPLSAGIIGVHPMPSWITAIGAVIVPVM
jgi:hypothetical protein